MSSLGCRDLRQLRLVKLEAKMKVDDERFNMWSVELDQYKNLSNLKVQGCILHLEDTLQH